MMTRNVLCFSLLTILCLSANLPVLGQNRVEYKDARIVAFQNTIIASEAPGIVKGIEVKPGSLIPQDEPLVRLNSELFQAEYDVAVLEEEIAKLQATNRVNLDFAQKSAEVSDRTLRKSMEANQQYARTIPSTEIERLRLQYDQARLSGDQAAMELDVARWTSKLKARTKDAAQIKLDNRIIRAPISGTIAQVHVQLGQWVNAGDPIVRIVDLKNLRVEGYFQQEFIRKIKTGNSGSFEYKIGDEVVQAPVKVIFVSPEVVEGIFQVWAELDNPNLIHIPGVQGKLAIELPN